MLQFGELNQSYLMGFSLSYSIAPGNLVLSTPVDSRTKNVLKS